MNFFKLLPLIFLGFILSSCVADNAQEANPKVTKSSVTAKSTPINMLDFKKYARGGFTVGKSYQMKGQTFTPAIDIDYVETGIASWYGPGFHGKKTANGAVYNQHEMTAAHPTLPLPCVVKVTNLENNRMIKVVVNDRGPFHHKGQRIIDLSKKAASTLGMMRKGTSKVVVEYDYEDTKELLAHLSKQQQARAVNAYNEVLTHEFALRDIKDSKTNS